MNLIILPLEFSQSLKDSMLIGLIIISAISVLWLISALLRNYELRHELKKLKTWRKFSQIEKKQRQKEYDRLALELAEENYFSDIQSDMHVRLMLKYASIEEDSEKTKHILLQKETFITELKKSFEQAIAEIKKLKSENELIELCNKENLKQIAFLKAVKNHKKRPKFEPKVKEWEYIGFKYNPYNPSLFENGNKYLVSDVNVSFNKETSLCLICENGSSVICDKAFFKPIKT